MPPDPIYFGGSSAWFSDFIGPQYPEIAEPLPLPSPSPVYDGFSGLGGFASSYDLLSENVAVELPNFSMPDAVPVPVPTAAPDALSAIDEFSSPIESAGENSSGVFDYLSDAADRMGEKMWDDLRLFGGAIKELPFSAAESAYDFVTGLPKDASDYVAYNYSNGTDFSFFNIGNTIGYGLWKMGGAKPENINSGFFDLIGQAAGNFAGGVRNLWNNFDTKYNAGDMTGAGAVIGQAAGPGLFAGLTGRALGLLRAEPVVVLEESAISAEQAIERARAVQGASGIYNVDHWDITKLKPGDIVFGGSPGQSNFYTNAVTLEASGGSATAFSESLQIVKKPLKGYRPQVQAYEVVSEIQVPSGVALANPAYGAGNGFQYFIDDYATYLRPIGEPLSLIR